MIDTDKLKAALVAVAELNVAIVKRKQANDLVIEHEEALLVATGWKRDGGVNRDLWHNESIGEADPINRQNAVEKVRSALVLVEALVGAEVEA